MDPSYHEAINIAITPRLGHSAVILGYAIRTRNVQHSSLRSWRLRITPALKARRLTTEDLSHYFQGI
jgi:hypothetical protein